MKIDAAFYVLTGMFATLATPIPLAAQEKTDSEITSYVGSLSGSCSTLRGRTIKIDIEGKQIKGSVEIRNGERNFEGELEGSSFKIPMPSTTASKTGVQPMITGTVEAGKITLRYELGDCRSNATMQKKS